MTLEDIEKLKREKLRQYAIKRFLESDSDEDMTDAEYDDRQPDTWTL